MEASDCRGDAAISGAGTESGVGVRIGTEAGVGVREGIEVGAGMGVGVGAGPGVAATAGTEEGEGAGTTAELQRSGVRKGRERRGEEGIYRAEEEEDSVFAVCLQREKERKRRKKEKRKGNVSSARQQKERRNAPRLSFVSSFCTNCRLCVQRQQRGENKENGGETRKEEG